VTTRHDVSTVPMQGGYVAKQCPVRAQNNALKPSEPLLRSPVLERRFERGRVFETEIAAQFLRLRLDVVVIAGMMPLRWRRRRQWRWCEGTTDPWGSAPRRPPPQEEEGGDG
jgi:hypothetical protein